MSKFTKLIKFLQLVDREGNLSISNVAVIVIITKMAISPFDWATAAALLVSLLNYGHKRYESNKTIAKAQEETELSDMKQKLDSLSEQFEDMAQLNETITKQSEDVKKLINASTLAGAFGSRKQ